MRKLIFAIIMTLSVFTAIGKDVASKQCGYFGTTRASFIISDCSPYRPGLGFSVDVINGYSFNHWFSLGGGISAIYSIEEGGNNVRVPIYIHLRADVINRKVAPFFALNLGGGFCKGYLQKIINGADAEANGCYGFYSIEPQAGIAVRLKNGKLIDCGVSAHADFGRGINVIGKFGVGFTW